jgi:hypothetical protein
MGGAKLARRLLTASGVGVVALTAAGGSMAGGGILNVQVLPNQLAPGGSGVVATTFTTSAPLTNVVIRVSLAGGTFAAAGSSASCVATPSGASCSLGNVDRGRVVVSSIAFTSVAGAGPWTFTAGANWGRNGLDTTNAQATANPIVPPGGTTVLAETSGCPGAGGTVSVSNGAEGVDATAGANPAGLPCTPIVAGIATDPAGGSDQLFLKLPTLQQPVRVVLTFADDNLPFSADHHEPLHEYPNYPSLAGGPVSVPFCNQSGPPIPAGSDSCIASIDPTDADADAGTVTLLVLGNGVDPSFH